MSQTYQLGVKRMVTQFSIPDSFDIRQLRYQTASIPVNFDPSQQTATHINEALAEAKSPLVRVSRNRRTVGRHLGIYPSNGCAYNHKACP